MKFSSTIRFEWSHRPYFEIRARRTDFGGGQSDERSEHRCKADGDALGGAVVGRDLGRGTSVSEPIKPVKAAEWESESIHLTYTKWFVSQTGMEGFVGGDLTGTFSGTLTGFAVDDGYYLLEATYVVNASDPSKSFTAAVKGRQNIETGIGKLRGEVVSGWLKGEDIRARFLQKTSCVGTSVSPCFVGTIRVDD